MWFLQPARRSALSDTDESQLRQIYADFAGRLITQARGLYTGEDLGLDLKNAVKTQIRIAVKVYVLVAIVKKRLGIETSLYTLLQIFSVTLVEKIPIQKAFQGVNYRTESEQISSRLNLLDFQPDTTDYIYTFQLIKKWYIVGKKRNIYEGLNMKNPFQPGYYTENDLLDTGFKSIGSNVRIAKNCTIIGIENIQIGDNVRIDGNSTFSAVGGYIKIGSYVHIAGYCFLSGGSGITLDNFSGISQGVKIYSKTDDYSGKSLTNPTIPKHMLKTISGPVSLERHVIIGSGSIIMPNLKIGEGSAVGALSLVNKRLDTWGIYFGIPAKRIKSRDKKLLDFENQLINNSF